MLWLNKFLVLDFIANRLSDRYIRHGISDDPCYPGSCKILDSCVKF